jgi:hypothetical protein
MFLKVKISRFYVKISMDKTAFDLKFNKISWKKIILSRYFHE